MKTRVMYSSRKKKLIAYAEAIGQECGCLVNDIPPAYPAQKERLVVIAVSMKGAPSDTVRRFCSELNAQRTQNVALLIDGPKDRTGEAALKTVLRDSGTNVIDDTYYVKCGLFSSKLSESERASVVEWIRRIQNLISEK